MKNLDIIEKLLKKKTWTDEDINTPLIINILDYIKKTITNLDESVASTQKNKNGKISDQKVYTILSLLAKAIQQQSQQNKNYLPVLHGKATDTVATMAGSLIVENPLNNTGTITKGEVKLVIEKFNELTGTLGVSTHKLLSTAIANFTALNHTSSKTKQANCTVISIPLKEYALHCGYDVNEHETTTEEESIKEANRAKNALDNARKKIQKDLTILYSASLSWTEKVRGKQGDYLDIRLVEAKGIKNGYIQLRFSQTFSEYLVQLPLTQYPIALLSVDERNTNAYAMGLKFTEHYNMDNNQKIGTAQLLKVNTLLNVTSLPSIEKVRADNRLWEDRIKEPFETALDILTRCGLLENWEYTHSKAIPMTDEEAMNWESYEEWANSFIHFTLNEAPNHEARLESKIEEKKQSKPKRTRKRNIQEQ